ncbi:hypothetical protein BCR43DRAFT_499075, partial [Syncephalastrum racemosum]
MRSKYAAAQSLPQADTGNPFIDHAYLCTWATIVFRTCLCRTSIHKRRRKLMPSSRTTSIISATTADDALADNHLSPGGMSSMETRSTINFIETFHIVFPAAHHT